MSNPGVISLVSIKDLPYRFEIEDNIGEAIHLHFQDIRLDLSIQDFERLAQQTEDVLNILYGEKGFKCSDFNETFLFGLAKLLPQIEAISEDKVPLNEMMVDTFTEEGEHCYRPLEESRVMKALRGDQAENDGREQVNLFEAGAEIPMSNKTRVIRNLEYIQKNGYPNDSGLITLNGADNIILDGQHRAACLLYLHGDQAVPVRRLHFRERFSGGWTEKSTVAFNGSVYYATKETPMSEDTRIDLLWSPGEKYHIDLPEGVTELRFDPAVSGVFLLESISIESDAGELAFSSYGYKTNKGDVLFGDDPYITINTDGKDISWIEFQAEFGPLELSDMEYAFRNACIQQKQLSEELQENTGLKEYIQASEKQLKATDEALAKTQEWLVEKEKQLKVTDEALAKTREWLKERDENLQAVEEQLKKTGEALAKTQNWLKERDTALAAAEEQYMETETLLQETQSLLFSTETQLKEKCNEYDAVVSSLSWKLTKPFRRLGGKQIKGKGPKE